MSEILDKLKELSQSDTVPMHMPGHKRNSDAGDMSGYYDIDITEIDGFDNLHDADGIILEAEKRANSIYAADETHFLVNGSTCGVLAAVSCAVSKGGKIIVCRNCHKSFYHAAYLRELRLSFINPELYIINDEGSTSETLIPGQVSRDEVARAIEENPDAEAVFITSPTYEGVVSDVEAIAGEAHKKGMILIVDEAHGAHFSLYEGLPKGAVKAGADIVIHSLHKTLASMTQTALIHVQGDLVNRKLLRRFLGIYQSSSPSYVLMSSMDSCLEDARKNAEKIFGRLLDYRRRIEDGTKDLNNLYVPGRDVIPDPCKILICSGRCEVTGQRIYDILRIEYHIQLEMAGSTYGLAIITGYDTVENIDRLIRAIREIDGRIESDLEVCRNGQRDVDAKEKFSRSDSCENNKETSGKIQTMSSAMPRLPRMLIPFYKAWDAEVEKCDLSRASGQVCGAFINLYPPGIPMIIPGEIIEAELIKKIGRCINEGMNVQGVELSESGERLIYVCKPDD